MRSQLFKRNRSRETAVLISTRVDYSNPDASDVVFDGASVFAVVDNPRLQLFAAQHGPVCEKERPLVLPFETPYFEYRTSNLNFQRNTLLDFALV
jgi:hypothetical protein